jgi:hypothetical protein
VASAQTMRLSRNRSARSALRSRHHHRPALMQGSPQRVGVSCRNDWGLQFGLEHRMAYHFTLGLQYLERNR